MKGVVRDGGVAGLGVKPDETDGMTGPDPLTGSAGAEPVMQKSAAPMHAKRTRILDVCSIMGFLCRYLTIFRLSLDPAHSRQAAGRDLDGRNRLCVFDCKG